MQHFKKDTVAEIPVTVRIEQLRKAWRRERMARERFLTGQNRKRKVEEATAMLQHLDAIEEWCHKKGITV